MLSFFSFWNQALDVQDLRKQISSLTKEKTTQQDEILRLQKEINDLRRKHHEDIQRARSKPSQSIAESSSNSKKKLHGAAFSQESILKAWKEELEQMSATLRSRRDQLKEDEDQIRWKLQLLDERAKKFEQEERNLSLERQELEKERKDFEESKSDFCRQIFSTYKPGLSPPSSTSPLTRHSRQLFVEDLQSPVQGLGIAHSIALASDWQVSTNRGVDVTSAELNSPIYKKAHDVLESSEIQNKTESSQLGELTLQSILSSLENENEFLQMELRRFSTDYSETLNRLTDADQQKKEMNELLVKEREKAKNLNQRLADVNERLEQAHNYISQLQSQLQNLQLKIDEYERLQHGEDVNLKLLLEERRKVSHLREQEKLLSKSLQDEMQLRFRLEKENTILAQHNLDLQSILQSQLYAQSTHDFENDDSDDASERDPSLPFDYTPNPKFRRDEQVVSTSSFESGSWAPDAVEGWSSSSTNQRQDPRLYNSHPTSATDAQNTNHRSHLQNHDEYRTEKQARLDSLRRQLHDSLDFEILDG
eukprot:TRINITY_DN7058_c0_g1_i7.p1 TRINITY_DN7058_c0_g1~~TRINITY_DN7058_c0_g1_i7.p1  ORF type:complete len:536 (-),score=122.42 TRINITY_DN7058_c0_g1_i7:199-1806(-)